MAEEKHTPRASARGALASASAHLEQEHLMWFLDSIVENVPLMIFVKDAEHLRFTLFNKACEALIGIKREELYGKSDFDIFPQEQAEQFTTRDREVLKSKALLAVEEPIDTVHGRRQLYTKKIPILDEKGTPRFLLGVSEDITERKAQEEELVRGHRSLEETLAQIMELEPLAIAGRQARAIAQDLVGAAERPAGSEEAVKALARSLAAVVNLPADDAGEVDLAEVASTVVADAGGSAGRIHLAPVEVPLKGRGRRADAVRIAKAVAGYLATCSDHARITLAVGLSDGQPALTFDAGHDIPLQERASLLLPAADLPLIDAPLRGELAVARVAAARSSVIGIARGRGGFEIRFCPVR